VGHKGCVTALHTPIRPATSADIDDLAALHVAAWRECYPGLLPEEEISRHGIGLRLAQWATQITQGHSRIMLAPGCGFAQMGPQRDAACATLGYAEELYALYVLRAAYGTGLGEALLRAVVGRSPWTALVIEGNRRACRFYERMGGHVLDTRDEWVGTAPIRERVYGWAATV